MALSEKKLMEKFSGAGMASEIFVEETDRIWLPCKSPVINHVMTGGIPYGRIVEFFGEESSGKSLLAMDFVRSAQKLGGIGIWVDAEFAFDRKWGEENGLDMDKLVIYPEVTVERISDFMKESLLTYRAELLENEPIVLVIDSLAALDTEEALATNQMDSKAEMGTRAKAIYRMIRTRNPIISKTGAIVICINQLRDKVGVNAMFGGGDSETTPGGRAMKFFASQRVGLYNKKQVTVGSSANKTRIGQEISFRMKKNKVGPPRAPYSTEVVFDPDYGDLGFSKYKGLLDILMDLETVTKSGNSIAFDGEIIARGKDHFDEVISEDKELRADLLKAAKINTLGTTKELLESITENRYAVKE